MSLISDSRRTTPDLAGVSAAYHCERCGAALAHDQEWCIECGTARTVIHRAPSWRVPAAIIAIVVVLVLAAFAIALINLSSEANRSAAASARTITVTPGARRP